MVWRCRNETVTAGILPDQREKIQVGPSLLDHQPATPARAALLFLRDQGPLGGGEEGGLRICIRWFAGDRLGLIVLRPGDAGSIESHAALHCLFFGNDAVATLDPQVIGRPIMGQDVRNPLRKKTW